MSEPPVAAQPLFLLDYDGTLADIVEDPTRAVPHPRAPQLLSQLAETFPLRILTGRRVVDLARLLPVPQLVALGVHGLEEGRLGGAVHWRLDEDDLDLLQAARESLPQIDGVRAEDKGGAIALHYRGAQDEERVLAELRAWVTDLPSGLERVWGKKIVEVRPRGFDKGRAALETAQQHSDRTPVMIGDDTTDEDAFLALNERFEEAVTVKVGEGETGARYRLAGITEVIDYLQAYLR